MILNYFTENNIRTLLASGRREMVRQFGSREVNLVILDLRLGQEDGLDLLREVRSNSDVPVIICYRSPRQQIDRVVGQAQAPTIIWSSRSVCAITRARAPQCCVGLMSEARAGAGTPRASFDFQAGISAAGPAANVRRLTRLH
jgi:CheY-like chemotaxis protein